MVYNWKIIISKYKWRTLKVEALSVDKSAIGAYFSTRKGLHICDVAQLDHGVGEVLEEDGRVVGILDDEVLRLGTGKEAGVELLVRVEETLSHQKELVEGAVKDD